MKRFFKWLWKYLKPFTNPRFLISFGIAWIITNGIWYVFAFVPIKILPDWLIWFSRSYIAFLYLPWTPEKLITIPLAIFVHLKLFKRDSKTHEQLEELYTQAKLDWSKFKSKFKRKSKKKEDN